MPWARSWPCHPPQVLLLWESLRSTLNQNRLVNFCGLTHGNVPCWNSDLLLDIVIHHSFCRLFVMFLAIYIFNSLPSFLSLIIFVATPVSCLPSTLDLMVDLRNILTPRQDECIPAYPSGSTVFTLQRSERYVLS